MRTGLGHGVIGAAVIMLGACNPTASPTGTPTDSPTGLPTVAVAASTGLSAADQAGIKADVVSRLLQRKRPYVYNRVQLCSEFFSIGEPTIIDSTLGEQTGKVRLLVPMTVTHPINNGGQLVAPDTDCYGYSKPGWLPNQPYDVTFEFQIERWQTGWRVAQVQENGF